MALLAQVAIASAWRQALAGAAESLCINDPAQLTRSAVAVAIAR